MAATNVQRFSGDVLLSGEMNLQHVSNTASIKLNSNVVTEFPRSKKLIKYPREAIPGNNSAVGSGYTYTASDGDYVIKASSEYDYRFYASNAFDNNKTTQSWLSADSTQGFRYTSGNPITSDTLASSTFTKFGAYGEWIELKLPTSIYLGYVLVYPKDNRVGYLNTSAIVWGSNTGNDGEWQRLSTFTSFGNYSEANPAKIVIDSLVSYNYYAYQITGINSTTTQYSVVSELEYFGIPEYDPDAHGTDVTVKSYPNVPNTDWLEVYYDAKDLADGAVTSVDDLTPNGTNDGTATNVTVSDGAFVFNGTSSLLEKTSLSIPGGDNPFTFSFWIKNDDFDSTQYILRLGDNQTMYQNVNIYKTSSNQIVFTTWLLDFPINYTFTSNRWNHISLMYPGGGWEQSNLIVYVDGKRFNFGANRSSGGTGGNVMTLATSLTLRLGGFSSGNMHFDGSIANFRLFNRALTQDEVWQLYAYQKEYFGHGNLSMTLKAGRLGIGTSKPEAVLDVRGDVNVQGTITTFTHPYSPSYSLTTISPDVWAIAGESTARIGGGAISYTSGVSIKYHNGVPMWFFGSRDESVDILNTINHTTNTWSVAIAIAKKPESAGTFFNQITNNENNTDVNHRIYWGGNFSGDEFRPSGNSWNTGTSDATTAIPDESVIYVKKTGTGGSEVYVYVNGGRIGQGTSNETYSGSTPTKIRLGQRTRYSGYSEQTPLYMGIAAIAAWDSTFNDNDMSKYITYQSLTAR
jgi:hypothetical protein